MKALEAWKGNFEGQEKEAEKASEERIRLIKVEELSLVELKRIQERLAEKGIRIGIGETETYVEEPA